MDSRIKDNPERTFDLILQVTSPVSKNEDPTVLWSFPQDHTDQEVLHTVPKFCFPFDMERVSQSHVGQNFTFVLTDIDGKQRFGFCRLTQGCRVCICLLSYLPWFEIYYKLLNTLADYLWRQQDNDLNDMLNSLYDLPVPKPFTPVNLSVHSYFIAPDINGLPTIPESRNLTEYFVAVDVNNMLQLYASMLHERRVIITSSKLSTLTACVHGAAALLFPMYWQHIFIPVLPPHLLDYCCAPMPYFVGVHLSLLERVRSRSLEDVVILNVDTNTLESPFDDLHNLPSDVVSSLKSKLKKQSTATGSGVARAFLRAQAALFGSYRDALRYKPGEPITFCEESFVNHRSSTMRNFLSMAVNLQLFKQFIDGRLAKLNAGRGFTDVFEEEITEGGFCGSSSRSYQQWMYTVKLIKSVTDTTLRSSLGSENTGSLVVRVQLRCISAACSNHCCSGHSVMWNVGLQTAAKWLHFATTIGDIRGGALINTAVTKAKSHAKRGIRDIKGRLKAREEEEEGITVCAGSPTSTKSLSPRRLQRMRRHNFNKSPMSMGPRDLGYGLDDDELDSASKISSEDSGDVPSYTEDSDDSYSLDLDIDSSRSGKMNLLEEILDSLSTTTMEQGKLSAAKSLDFFRSMEDLDYQVPPSKPSPCGTCHPSSEIGCEAGGEQGGWNMGQDDSAVHGKHLPPSPRRQPNKSSLKVSKKPPVHVPDEQLGPHPLPLGRQPGDRFSYSPSTSHRIPPTPPSPNSSHTSSSSSSSNHSPLPTSRVRTISEPKTSTEPPQAQNPPGSTGILRRKVLSKEMVRNYKQKSTQRQASKESRSRNSMQVPWEKDYTGGVPGHAHGKVLGATVQDRGLLEEIESMCCVGPVLHSGLQLSQVHCNNHSKATEQS
ncbi:DENN domain-containing protein 1B isoform X1 [Dunckerocampus dactyliophorus]|uniref:DENN domain-containing protein 1B isoform X1 n=1 Tax=Dunckerocampus dactyliophorus TaxID=161453 RepID=UPI0024073199|nr:DENN domain-containing protein 1B isoform X1 [Dunckerocampus dactyliophorus]